MVGSDFGKFKSVSMDLKMLVLFALLSPVSILLVGLFSMLELDAESLDSIFNDNLLVSLVRCEETVLQSTEWFKDISPLITGK